MDLIRVHGFEEKINVHESEKKKIARGWWWCRYGANVFWNLTLEFDIYFKNTLNLIFLGFKWSYERFENRSYFLKNVV